MGPYEPKAAKRGPGIHSLNNMLQRRPRRQRVHAFGAGITAIVGGMQSSPRPPARYFQHTNALTQHNKTGQGVNGLG